jgi:hypothetical protein
MFWCRLYHGIAQLGVSTVKCDRSALPSGSAVVLLRLQRLETLKNHIFGLSSAH